MAVFHIQLIWRLQVPETVASARFLIALFIVRAATPPVFHPA